MHFSHGAHKKSNIQQIEHLITEPFSKLFQSDAPLVSMLLFYFHIFKHKPITGLQSKIHSIMHLVSLSEDTFIDNFFIKYLVCEHVTGCCITSCCFFGSSHHKLYIFKTFCQFKIIFQDYVSFRCTPSSCFWMRKHIQLAIDSPNLYIICILHITTHY